MYVYLSVFTNISLLFCITVKKIPLKITFQRALLFNKPLSVLCQETLRGWVFQCKYQGVTVTITLLYLDKAGVPLSVTFSMK